MKNIFTIFTLVFCISLNAQFKEGKIYFKDNKTIKGLVKVKTLGGIKFKTTSDSGAKDYSHEQIKGYDVNGWQYRYLKDNKTLAPKLLKLILEGEISLYSKIVKNPNSAISNGSPSGGIKMIINPFPTKIYYLKSKDSVVKIGTTIKKSHLEFFKNCPELIKKIKTKEFKKWEIYEIIDFYNFDCTEQ